jgi:hypothetical protein
MYTVRVKGGKPDRKPYPLPNGLRNPYRNLKSEHSQDFAKKPQHRHFHETKAKRVSAPFLKPPW